MGVDTETARFLLQCRKDGASFKTTLCFGHQTYFPSNKETERLLREFGIHPADHSGLFQNNMQVRYCDEFFKMLGCQQLRHMDASEFEGADIVHDLNKPIRYDLRCRFDVVFDGGTLEHVFNFPTGLKNALEMVKVGGHFISCNPTNNFFGHGFYQLEPDCFHRTLTKENGFVMVKTMAVEYRPFRKTYRVLDPASQMKPASKYPVNLLVCGQKVEDADIMGKAPVQTAFSSPLGKTGVHY